MPKFLDFELSSAMLGKLIVNRARAQTFYYPGDFMVSGFDVLLDHVEFPVDSPPILLAPAGTTVEQTFNVAGGGTAKVTSRKIRVPIDIQLRMKLVSVAQNPDDPPDSFVPVAPGTLTLDLSMSGAPAALTVEIVDLAIPGVDPGALATAKQAIAGSSFSVPFDPSSVDAVLGGGTAQNVALAAASSDGTNVSVVAIRVELGDTPATTQADWQQFVDGFQPQIPAGLDWGVQIDQSLIVALVNAKLEGALDGDSSVTRTSPATGSWSAGGASGGGHVSSSADGYVSPSQCPNNIGATFSVDVDLELAGGAIVEHGYFDWDLTDGDVFVCGLAVGGPGGAAIGAIIGAAVGGIIGAIVGAVVGAMVGTIVVAIVISVFSGKQQGVQGALPAPACQTPDPHHFVCTQSLGLAPLDFGGGVTAQLTATVMKGLAAGPFLAGTALVTNVGNPLFATTDDVGADTIQGGEIGTCHSYGAGYLWHVKLEASQMPAGPNTILLGDVNSAIQILGDPDNVYTPYWSLDPNNIFLPAQITFQLPVDNSLPFFNHPYQPTLYIRTSSGSHAIRLPELVPVAQPSLAQITQQIAQNAVNCEKIAAGWLGVAGKFDPQWLVDPGPDDGSLDVIDFQVASAALGEVITAQAAGRTLASAPGGGTLAALSLAIAGTADTHVGAAAPVELLRTTSATGGVAPALAAAGGTPVRSTQLDARVAGGPIGRSTQRRLQRAATLRTYGGGARRVALARHRGQVCAVVAGARGVELVSLRTPSDPRTLDLVLDADGALPSGTSVISWGRQGLRLGGRRVDDAPVTQLVARGRCFYVLDARGLAVYDRTLAPVTRVAVENTGSMQIAGARLAITSAQGLELFALDDPAAPRRLAPYPLAGVTALESPPIANGSRLFLVERGDGPFLLLDVAGDAPRIVAEYFTRPWFAAAAAREGLVARVVDGAVQVFVERTRKAQVF